MIRCKLGGASWKFRVCGDEKWYKACVPGTLFLDMMQNGIIENPYYRFNERQFAELAKRDYEYRSVFCVDEKIKKKENQVLVFEGLDTITSIFLNGEKIADTDNMHRTYRFEVGRLLKQGENEIHILFYSPVKYIEEQHKAHPLPEFNTASPHGFSQIRKIHSSFGWDAEPVVPDSGIWRDVYLEAYDQVKLDHIYVRQRHQDKKVWLDAEVYLDQYTQRSSLSICPSKTGALSGKSPSEEYRVHMRLEDPDGILKAEGNVSIADGRGIWNIAVDDPQLWWPNGYGEQPLYKLSAALVQELEEGEAEDRTEIQIGLRKAEVRREPDRWGESFAFYINDVPVYAKGGCYTPPDKFLTLCRGKRHEDLIRYCAQANFNCIRVWGGAVFPDDEFYDLCDRYGILVWQDLMFACALYHVTDAFVDNISAETRDNVIRLRNHPSLMLWCGSNENEWFHDFEHELEGLTYELRMDNLRQYEVHLKEVVRKYDPDRLYWPSSPSSGGGYKDPNGYEKGDVHCWYVWYLPAKPYTFYRECKARFVSEFGLESFQSIKTLCHYMEPEDMSPNSEVMDFMQRCSDNHCNMGNGKIISYIFQEVRPPENFREYVYASQYAQAEGIKYGACHFRRMKPRCMGSLYWQIVDCFPGTTWSGIDYEYRWKILHYYAKRFYQNTMISVSEHEKMIDLYVVHDGQEGFDAKVQWALRKNDGICIKCDEKEVFVKGDSSELVRTLDFSDSINEESKTECYLEFQITDCKGMTISSDTHLFVKPKHFQFLAPQLSWHVKEEGEEFQIELQTDVYTKCIFLDLEKADAIFSDNCFDLSPGQKKTVCIRKGEMSSVISKEELERELCCQCLNTLGKG